jgi:translation initiation factor IF-2
VSKVRIYELARETGLPNKEVIARLGELGVEAKSHSSSVTEADANRFRESLGTRRAERQQAEEEAARREAEAYDVTTATKAASGGQARQILPPHLRQQQQDSDGGEGQAAPAAQARESSQPSAGEAPAAQPSQGGSARRFRPATAGYRPGAQTGTSVGGSEQRGATSGQSSQTKGSGGSAGEAREASPRSGGEETDARQPAARGPEDDPARPQASPQETARSGVVRPATEEEGRGGASTEEPEPQPGTPRPGTPPRPGQPTVPRPQRPSSRSTGEPAESRRRVDHDLPREGSGRRSVPPPVRSAPESRSAPDSRQGESRPGESRPGNRGGGPPRGRGKEKEGQGQPGKGAGPDGGRGAPGKSKKSKKRKKEPTPQEQFEEQEAPKRAQAGPVKATISGPVDVLPGVPVDEFANQIGVNPTDIVRVLFGMGEMVTVTQAMSQDLIELVASELEAEVNFVTPDELEFGADEEEDPADLAPRAPVVTVMGHVDHGKTLLLDTLRAADVASGEAGGITQHIGAYQVPRNGRAITFIDTPGHEAFTQMRARGAQVTDVAILVVAADDGVKPQTVEAINHIKAADVPLVVAINKTDTEGADPTRTRSELTQHDLVAEELGGQTTMVDISAKTGEHLDELLDMVLLTADVADVTANPDRRARGAVVEAHLDRGRGPVATVLIQQGTLRTGDNLVAGSSAGKVRAMLDEHGASLKEAGPSKPALVLGWEKVANAGDEFRVVDDGRTARDIAENRASRDRQAELAARKSMSLEDLPGAIAEGELTTLNVIVKGDVAGSVEAVADALDALELDEVRIRLVHKGAGAVTENDVSLAEASSAVIIAFNVRPEANARRAVEDSGVDLRHYSVIYEVVEDIERAAKGLLGPTYEEVTTGRIEVREVFKVPRAGYVLGSYVTEGSVKRHASARVIRDGAIVAEDTVNSLRRFKDDVTEVASGYECGIGLAKFQDVKVGDEVEVLEQREVARV